MILRIAPEEIIIQQVADLEQQVGVDPGTVQNLVDVLTGAAQLFPEPGDGTALLLQHLFNNMSDMGLFHKTVPLTSKGNNFGDSFGNKNKYLNIIPQNIKILKYMFIFALSVN